MTTLKPTFDKDGRTISTEDDPQKQCQTTNLTQHNQKANTTPQ